MSQLESAIKCFQETTGLRVTIHDLTNQLWRALPLSQFRHCHAACEAIKKGPMGDECVRFETTAFRREANQWRQGRLHRCHAGYTELVMPVFERDRLRFILFAGPAMIDDSSHLDYIAPSSGPTPAHTRRYTLPELKAAQLPVLREQLIQLGTRLRCWVKDEADLLPDTATTRSARIRRYFEDHFSEPVKLGDLADRLNLSPERTRHLVKEETGMTFSRLLLQTRLKAASALLLNSDLPVSAVAQLCGLPDPSSFNRYFKRAFDHAPRQWRLRHRG